MKSLSEAIDSIYSLVRACPICSDFCRKNLTLCSQCERFLNPQNQGLVKAYPFPVISLYDWKNDDILAHYNFVRTLKGGIVSDIFADFAKKLVQKRLGWKRTGLSQAILVPAALRKNSRSDHALQLAQQISKLINCKHVYISYRDGEGEQKIKSRKERWQNIPKSPHPRNHQSYQVTSPDGLDFSCETTFIFVDDVITTGATAQKAYLDLGQPKHFEVWTVLSRSRLK